MRRLVFIRSLFCDPIPMTWFFSNSRVHGLILLREQPYLLSLLSKKVLVLRIRFALRDKLEQLSRMATRLLCFSPQM